jgi:hypothetical protein
MAQVQQEAVVNTVNDGESLDQLNEYQPFKKSSTSWSYTVPCTSAFLHGLEVHLLQIIPCP